LRIVRTIDTGGVPRQLTWNRAERALLIANEAGWIDIIR